MAMHAQQVQTLLLSLLLLLVRLSGLSACSRCKTGCLDMYWLNQVVQSKRTTL